MAYAALARLGASCAACSRMDCEATLQAEGGAAPIAGTLCAHRLYGLLTSATWAGCFTQSGA